MLAVILLWKRRPSSSRRAVYNFIDEHIRYVDPSFAQDLDPHWSGNDAISYTRRNEGQPDIQLTRAVEPTATVQGAAAAHKALLETLLGFATRRAGVTPELASTRMSWAAPST